MDWKLKCPSFQNAQRHIAQGNILPNDFMPNMTICPRRHFAQRFYAQGDNLPKEDIMPKMTFCPYFWGFLSKHFCILSILIFLRFLSIHFTKKNIFPKLLLNFMEFKKLSSGTPIFEGVLSTYSFCIRLHPSTASGPKNFKKFNLNNRTQVFEFKKRMLFVQETMASTDFSGLFSNLLWCHHSYEAPI